MVLITLKPQIARVFISLWEKERNTDTYAYLENKIRRCEWNSVAPIWITPNFIFNRIWLGLRSSGHFQPTLKPFIMYDGHHRLEKAIEHDLDVRAYIRYTLWNPPMREEERLVEDYGF